jgi:hypothetical protein
MHCLELKDQARNAGLAKSYKLFATFSFAGRQLDESLKTGNMGMLPPKRPLHSSQR